MFVRQQKSFLRRKSLMPEIGTMLYFPVFQRKWINQLINNCDWKSKNPGFCPVQGFEYSQITASTRQRFNIQASMSKNVGANVPSPRMPSANPSTTAHSPGSCPQKEDDKHLATSSEGNKDKQERDFLHLYPQLLSFNSSKCSLDLPSTPFTSSGYNHCHFYSEKTQLQPVLSLLFLSPLFQTCLLVTSLWDREAETKAIS